MSDVDLGPRRVRIDRDWLHPAALGLFVVAFAATCALSIALTPLFMFLCYASPLVFVWWTATRTRDTAARVTADALVLDGVRTVPRTSITAGYVTQERDAIAAALTLRDGTQLRIAARDPDDARAVLAALGQDPSQRRTEFRHGRIFHQLLSVLLGPLLGVFVAIPVLDALRGVGARVEPALALVVGALVLTAATLFTRRLLFPRLHVTIGRDGMWTRGRLRARFIPWSSVASAREVGDSVELTDASGARTRIWCDPDDAWVRPALVARIGEALRTWRSADARTDPLTLLAREGRSVATWRAFLTGLTDAVGGYRQATLDRARLEAALVDPAATPERRIAAALALSATDEGRTRVRVAADAGAEPAERAALEAIAEGRDAEPEVEAALRRETRGT